MSIGGKMDKQNVVAPYNGIVFNFKKKEILTHFTTWMYKLVENAKFPYQ
jgi:hypothetical protein